jgi:hypothetical protein
VDWENRTTVYNVNFTLQNTLNNLFVFIQTGGYNLRFAWVQVSGTLQIRQADSNTCTLNK